MYRHRPVVRTLALLAAGAAIAFPAAAGWVTITYSPGATTIRSGCVAAGQYERTPVSVNGAGGGQVTIEGLPDAGRCYFAQDGGDELYFDFDALKGGSSLPGAIETLTVTWAPTPASPVVAVSMLQRAAPNTDEFDLSITGSAPVTLALIGGAVFDWIKSGTTTGVGGTVIPTSPPLGANNNDGVTAAAVTINGPVSAHVDTDGPAFVGATAAVAGVVKPLVRAGSTWSAVFP